MVQTRAQAKKLSEEMQSKVLTRSQKKTMEKKADTNMPVTEVTAPVPVQATKTTKNKRGVYCTPKYIKVRVFYNVGQTPSDVTNYLTKSTENIFACLVTPCTFEDRIPGITWDADRQQDYQIAYYSRAHYFEIRDILFKKMPWGFYTIDGMYE